METKKCLYCGKDVPSGYTICPYCRSAKFDVQNEQDDMPVAIVEKPKIKSWIWIVVAVVFFLFIIALILNGIKECDHNYTEEIVSEATYSETGLKELVCSECGETATETIPVLPAVVEVEVLDKYEYEEAAEPMILPDGTSIERLPVKSSLFDIKITNISSETVRGVKGTLKVKSGETVLNIMCDFSELNIPASYSYTEKGYGYEFTGYSNQGELMVYITPYEDLEFEFEVTEIIY